MWFVIASQGVLVRLNDESLAATVVKIDAERSRLVLASTSLVAPAVLWTGPEDDCRRALGVLSDAYLGACEQGSGTLDMEASMEAEEPIGAIQADLDQ